MRGLQQTDALEQLVRDLYAATGQRVGVFTADMELITEHPRQHGVFCHMLRKIPDGRRRCRECDRQGMRDARAEGGTVIYRCHAGLLEVCTPIRYEGELLGFLMFGQVLYDRDLGSQWKVVEQSCRSLVPDAAALYRGFTQVRRIDPETLQACARVMAACVGYVRLGELLQTDRDGKWNRIRQVLDSHAGEPTALSVLAEELAISVATLCKTTRKMTGQSVGEYMIAQRMARACKLLAETDRPIAAIAEAVGMEDYNYFSRLFKRQVGCTPSVYRQRGGHAPTGKP